MALEIMEGNTFKTKLVKNGDTRYLLINREMREYLDIDDETPLIIKFDTSKKNGRFIGFGKEKQ